MVTGPARGRMELLPRIVCDSTGDAELPFTLRRLQFPLRPAWAISINKSQGQGVEGRLGIYLPTPVFSHGQLYVAHSRSTASVNVRVFAESYEDQQRKLPLGAGSDAAALYTLNLVDQTLLSDEAGTVAAATEQPITIPADSVDGVVSPDVSSRMAAEVCEQHRLATVSPDPLSMPGPSRSSLAWPSGHATCHPYAADEWASAEVGMPCACGGGAVTAALLEERGPDDLEYESEGEAATQA